MTCDHKFVDSNRCLRCGWEAQKRSVPIETAEQRLERDRFPFAYEMLANVPRVITVCPRYPRAFVLGIRFDAPDLEALEVQGIQMEHFEQLSISPLPAVDFNDARSVILPVAHAALGLDLKLRSVVSQRITVAVHFSECRSGEPRA